MRAKELREAIARLKSVALSARTLSQTRTSLMYCAGKIEAYEELDEIVASLDEGCVCVCHREESRCRGCCV